MASKSTRVKSSPLQVDTDWQAQSDLECFLRWQEIRKDARRLAAVKKLAKEKLAGYAKAMSVEGDHDEDA